MKIQRYCYPLTNDMLRSMMMTSTHQTIVTANELSEISLLRNRFYWKRKIQAHNVKSYERQINTEKFIILDHMLHIILMVIYDACYYIIYTVACDINTGMLTTNNFKILIDSYLQIFKDEIQTWISNRCTSKDNSMQIAFLYLYDKMIKYWLDTAISIAINNIHDYCPMSALRLIAKDDSALNKAYANFEFRHFANQLSWIWKIVMFKDFEIDYEQCIKRENAKGISLSSRNILTILASVRLNVFEMYEDFFRI